MSTEPTEPWLSGSLRDVHPFLAPLLYSFQMVLEDIDRHTEGLTDEQLWARPGNIASTGFHIRHIGGSVDRLLSYAEGNQLSETQLAALKREGEPGASRKDLLAELQMALESAGARVRALDPERLAEARAVGRKRLPTTVIGLVVHIAEHTQRHVGQAVTTAKMVRGL